MGQHDTVTVSEKSIDMASHRLPASQTEVRLAFSEPCRSTGGDFDFKYGSGGLKAHED